MVWSEVEMKSFLTERKNRFKPVEANALDLKRLEKIDFKGNMYVSDTKPTKTNMILIKKGDLVISGINAEKGALGIYDGNEDILATIHYSSYHYDKTKINIEYLRWFLKSSRFKQLLMEHAGGGIKTEIKPKKLLPLKLKLPNLITQEQIAIKLKSVANDFNQLTWINIENKDLTSQLRQSILQLAVQGRLVPQKPNDEPASKLLEKINAEKQRLIKQGKIKKQKPLPPIKPNEIPYELPQGWEWVRLGETSLEASTGLDRSKTLQSPDYKYAYFKMNNISENGKCEFSKITRVDASQDEVAKYQLCDGDFLFNTRNSYELVGKTCVFADELGDTFLYNNNILRIGFASGVNPYFINLWFIAPAGKKLLNTLKSSTTNVAAIYQGKLMGFLLPIPPQLEQNRIVAKVNELMALCAELEEKLNQAKVDSDKLMASVVHHLLHRPLPEEQVVTDEKLSRTPYKDDAAVLCFLLAEMEKLHRPTTEFFVQKHIFAAKHHEHLSINSLFVRKAAGPWSHELKQKAIFAAIKMNWLRWQKSRLVAGPAFEKGLSHAASVLGEGTAQIAQLVEDLKAFGPNGLERWTTVLKVVEDLKERQQPITQSNIQREINNWPGKKLKEIFAEESIDYTIDMMMKHKWLSPLDKP